MSYPELKYRSRMSVSVDNGLLAGFNELSAELRIPKSWLADEAIEELLKKHGKTCKKTSRQYQA